MQAFLTKQFLKFCVDRPSSRVIVHLEKEANMTFGIMGYGSWFDLRYIIPRPLLLKSNAQVAGFQQYRWMKFFFTISC